MSTTQTPIEHRLNNPRDRVYLPEILNVISTEADSTHSRRVSLIRAYVNKSPENANLVRDFVQCVFHPDVKFDLPDGNPPYKTDFLDYNMAPVTLRQAFARVSYFVPGHSKFIIAPLKREQVFIQTLEGMFKPDSELFLMVKNKKIDDKIHPHLTEDFFREALPGLLPERAADTFQEEAVVDTVDVEPVKATEETKVVDTTKPKPKPKTTRKVTKKPTTDGK